MKQLQGKGVNIFVQDRFIDSLLITDGSKFPHKPLQLWKKKPSD